ncbi:hypothetical protein [Aquimarina sp. AU474]|uniref:hypothetical protein n=1 Tax=Aquimarina sp. AU474 TaxID=2108529 RepID=UPI000D697C1F|nr:hypothetical protein [Aquimarina sp. AU474]
MSKDNYAYWLPKSIIEVNTANPNQQTKTSFGYDASYRLTAVTRNTTYNDDVFTAFITYNEDGLISKIQEISTNPSISNSEFLFEYEKNSVTQIRIINTSTTKYINVTHNKEENIYSYVMNKSTQSFNFNDDGNLKTLQIGDIQMIEIAMTYQDGLCKDVNIQPALFLVQNLLHATNSFGMLLYNTQEVHSISYEGHEMAIENEFDEYGNIVKVRFLDHPDDPLELRIAYEMNNMRL